MSADGTVPTQQADHADEPLVDARDLGNTSCADLTSQAVERTAVGSAFVLVADHDPTPLHYMLRAEHPGECDWQPLEEGPETWRVRVTRIKSAG